MGGHFGPLLARFGGGKGSLLLGTFFLSIFTFLGENSDSVEAPAPFGDFLFFFIIFLSSGEALGARCSGRCFGTTSRWFWGELWERLWDHFEVVLGAANPNSLYI